MERVKNIVIISLVIVVVVVLAGIIYLSMQNQEIKPSNNDVINNEHQNNNEPSNNSTGKIDETKDIVYEKIVSQYNEYTVSLPVINIDNEEIKALNEKIIEDNGEYQFTNYEYFTYKDIVSIYIYLGMPAGDGYDITYNVNTATNTVIDNNNELFETLNVDAQKYMEKQKLAISKYFESYWTEEMTYNDNKSFKQLFPEYYLEAKEYTYDEKNNNLDNYIYVDDKGDIYVIGIFYLCAGREPPIYDHKVKVCNVSEVLKSEDTVKNTDEFYLDLVNKLPLQINMINKSFTDVSNLTDDQRLAIVLGYNLRNNYSQWETKQTGIVLPNYDINDMADVNTLENIKKSELELFGKKVIKEYKIKGALKIYSDKENLGLYQMCYSDKVKYTTNNEPCYFKDYEYSNRMYSPITIFEKAEIKGNICDIYVKQAYSIENGYVALDLYQQHGNRIMDYTTNKVIYSNHNYCLNEYTGEMTNNIRTDLDNLYNEYKDKMSTYKYRFKIEDGNYYLQSVAITPVSENISKNFGQDLYYVMDNATSFIHWQIYQDYKQWKTAYYVLDNKLYHYDMQTLKSTLMEDNVISIEYKDKKIEVLVKENSKTYNKEKDTLGILNYVISM